MDTEIAEQLLREQGCTLTPQRRAVLQFLRGNEDHPSAGEIFAAVTHDFPITSRATVYNTLTLLASVGAVHTVRGSDGEIRYDPNVAPHHHLCCSACGRLVDIAAAEVQVTLRGHAADGVVRFTGVCARCASAAV
jgi:Fe2+ or Zn2+ uptake regulation protein